MVLITICLLALDATLEWTFSRYKAVWVRPAILGAFVFLLFFGLQTMVTSENAITITLPSQTSCAISFGLVIAYYWGRRAYKLYQFTTGKARHPLQIFVMDWIKGNFRSG